MKVHELMRRDPQAAGPEWPLSKAIRWMTERSLRHLPVVEHGRLVGMISERDLLEATGWNPDRYVDSDHAPKVVRDYMSVGVESVDPEDDVQVAVARLLERRIGCLAVVAEQDRLVGLLTVADVLAALVSASARVRGVGELDDLVASRMSEAPITVGVNASAAEALDVARARGVRHLPVEGEGWFVGLVSDRDLRLCAGRGELERPVHQIMTTDLARIGPESLVSDAAELMLHRRVDCVPVTREGGLVGMLTTADVLGLLRDKLGGASGSLHASRS